MDELQVTEPNPPEWDDRGLSEGRSGRGNSSWSRRSVEVPKGMPEIDTRRFRL